LGAALLNLNPSLDPDWHREPWNLWRMAANLITPRNGSWSPHRSSVLGLCKFGLALGAAVWFFARGTERLGYPWQWYRVPRYLFSVEGGHFLPGPLLQGLLITLEITAVSLVLAFALGLVTALMRLSRSVMARWLARLYLEVVRNTPLLIQLFFLYFVLGPILDLDRHLAAVLALSLFEGAYAAEIFRAGIASIHTGQWEAAHSLGLSTRHTYLHVIFPQPLRRMLPPLTSQAVSLIKDSALVSTVAIYDLTMQGQVIVADTFLTFEVWFTVAAIYLLLTVTLSYLARNLELRFKSES
jgi:polar amino acid transport system permease protein